MNAAAGRLLSRLHHRDHRLLCRWSLPESHPRAARRFWIAVTQLGSAAVTITVALAVPALALPGQEDTWLPAAALALSHLVVQLIKRVVQRDRPVRTPVISCPDRFSFPSGHATASLVIALSLGHLLPEAGPALVPLGLLVGWSRVVLRVHYPGDVLAGQLIALTTMLVLSSS